MQDISSQPFEQLLDYLNNLSPEARARVSAELLSSLTEVAGTHSPVRQQTLGEYLYEIATGPKPYDFDPEFERIELDVREVDFE